MTAGLLIAALVVFVRPIGRFFFPIPYAPIVREHAAANGLDPFLVVAIMRVESGFDPRALSPKGARGLMQLLPKTAAWVAERMGEEPAGPDQLYNPATNIRLGTRHLAYLLERFHDEWAVALAAYNGGAANVRRWLADGEWTGERENLNQIPFPETRNFVGRVIRFYDWYRFLYKDEWSLTALSHRARGPSPPAPGLPRAEGPPVAPDRALSHR